MMATVASPAVQASTVTLRDDNAFIEAEAPATTDVINWTTAGVDHVSQQWYWYRVGADGSQGALDTLELQFQVLTDTDLDGHGDTLFLSYRDAGGAFRTSTRYMLNGGWAGFGISVLDERITIENTLDEPLIFHIIGFHDRQSADKVLDTSVQVVNGIQEVRTGGAITLHVTAITPSPNAVNTNTNTTILHTLADAAQYPFRELVGPPEPYDVSWAFQWTVEIPPRGAFQISKVMRMISGDAYCGDGIVGIDEQCDDGNLNDGDGCSANCTLERECRLLCSAPSFGDGDPHDATKPHWGYDSDGDKKSHSEYADETDEGIHGEWLGNPGNRPLRIGFEAEDHCGDVSAVIDIACDTIPVENGQLVKVLCIDPNDENGHECFFEFHAANGGDGRELLEIRSSSALLTVTATDDAGVTSICTEDLCAAAGNTTHWEDEIDCGCRGRLATLTLQYNGERKAFIEVEQTKGRDIVFSGVVWPGERFSFVGTVRGTLGSKIAVFTDTEPATIIPIKCSNSIGIGSVFGNFEVVDGADKYGGKLCPVD